MPIISKSARILLIDHEAHPANRLERALRRAGFATMVARTTDDALALARRANFDLVVLDLEQPGNDGHAVCDALHRDSGVPVVMLAESVAAADRDAWLDGAEDYVVKPARVTDVIARIRSVLRRTQAGSAFGVLHVGPLSIDTPAQRATFEGYELPLSPKEVQLLARLARDAGDVVSREQLMEDIWGADWFGSTKTLDVHIGWLRRKLGDNPAHPRCIHTVRGVGFRLASAHELSLGSDVRAAAHA